MKPPRLLLNLLMAGLLLRLLILGYWSLWLDEGVTWTWATYPTWAETLTAEANHPPLWWLVTRLQISLFGDSEASLRFPAALLSVIGMGLGWLLGLRLLDPARTPRRGGFTKDADPLCSRWAAVWFAGLMAGSAYLIEYAQEARMYTALFVEALGLALLYLRWLDKNDRGSLIAYAFVGVLTLHTHYFAVFILGGHALHALWLGWRTRRTAEPVGPWPFLAAVAAAALLFVPWIVWAVTHFERIARIEIEPFGKLAGALWRMGAGPAIAHTGTTVIVAAVLWGVPLALGVWALGRRPGVRALVISCAVLPVIGLLAASPWVVLVHERYLVFLAPWVFLLASLGVMRASRFLRPLVGLGLLALFAAGVVAYYAASADLEPVGQGAVLDGKRLPAVYAPPQTEALVPLQGEPPYGRTPWRDAHAFVRRHARPGDLVVLHPGYVHLVWDYYASREEEGLDQIRLPLEALQSPDLRAAHAEDLARRSRVFLVMGPPGTPDPDHYVRAFKRLLGRLWLAEGAGGLSSVPPIPFQLGWGIRVAVFDRS